MGYLDPLGSRLWDGGRCVGYFGDPGSQAVPGKKHSLASGLQIALNRSDFHTFGPQA